MSEYSEQDLKLAAELREEIHREALEIVRKTRPNVTEVKDRHPVEDYFQENWDYPGRWYTIVSIPHGYGSRKAFVDAIVRDTLSGDIPQSERETYAQETKEAAKLERSRERQPDHLDSKPDGYRELFTVEVGGNNRVLRAVGVDAQGRYILEQFEEYSLGAATGSAGAYYVLNDLQYSRYLRLALLNGQLTEEDYDRLTDVYEKELETNDDSLNKLLAEYQGLAVDYCIVDSERYCGYESHRRALKAAYGVIGRGWEDDPDKAEGRAAAAEDMFSSDYPKGKLNYRRAFLYPPHRNGVTGKDFVRVNAALFPEGTDSLEVYEWDTDWSEYFDDGHEWWGTLCLTVYDKNLDRFVVIMASATD